MENCYLPHIKTNAYCHVLIGKFESLLFDSLNNDVKHLSNNLVYAHWKEWERVNVR